MASLPEDDGPTMSGLPEGRSVDLPPDGDDTTSAEVGPPAAPADASESDEEDRTVQQQVAPPRAPPRADPPLTVAAPMPPSTIARPSPADMPPAVRAPLPTPAPVAVPPAPVTQNMGSTMLSASATSSSAPSTQPSTQPSAHPAALAPTRPAAGSTTEASERPPGEDDEELEEIDPDEDAIEDSITATAPRINAAKLIEAAQPSSGQGQGLPMVIPGSVEIRTVEHDDLADETEVRTRPGHIPLSIPQTLRASPAGIAMPVPMPSPRPAAGRPPSIAPLVEAAAPPDDDQGDDDDDGVTTEGPAPRIGSSPEIGAALTLMSKGIAAETAARGAPRSAPVSAPISTARSATDAALPVDSVDEPPTRPGVESADEPPTRPGVESADDPPTRPGLPEPPTRPGLGAPEEPETSKRVVPTPAHDYANQDDDAEESTTTHNQAITDFADSVTTKGPASLGVSTLDDGTDGTDGTTQKVKRTRTALSPGVVASASPADDEAESITTQAPGPLTNILRVIASGSSPELKSDSGVMTPIETEDEDEQPENRTAVMANAPLKRVISELVSQSALPAIRPTGGPLTHGPQASAAARLEPSSESGLRVARASGERASLGALGIAGGTDGRVSGIVANAMATDGSASAPIDVRSLAATEMAFPNGQPSLHDVDLGKGPRYGLLVAIVAVVSIIVPVTLFVLLRKGPDPAVVEIPSEPVSEIETTGPVRAKAPRNKNGTFVVPTASASAAPSGSSSAKGPGGIPPRGGPLHR